MNEDEERHADEVNIAFQMGAEWERKQSKARINQLEAALRKIADSMGDLPKYDIGNMYLWAVETAAIALEGKKDG